MIKALLIFGGAVYWLFLHRVVYIYMGEATFLTMLTALIGYRILSTKTPDTWTPWHVICFMSGGIFLEGTTRFF